MSRRLSQGLAAATVLAEIAYPLVRGRRGADGVTVATVLLFAGASTADCATTRGGASAVRMVAAAAGTGLAAEVVGVRTGRPFGRYSYAGTLGPEVGDVPLLIPLAWTMMAWPTLVVARRLAPGSRAGRALLGGVSMAGWDLFLDPQMVDAGHWSWVRRGPALHGIPLTNAAGWLAVGTALTGLLDVVVAGGPDVDERVPLTLWLWTYGSSVLAHLAFFRRPGVALSGGLGMGSVAVPLVRRLLADR